ncbi:hypothetical protein VUR80DRAFT_4652 [Thermomyces stellatus]
MTMECASIGGLVSEASLHYAMLWVVTGKGAPATHRLQRDTEPMRPLASTQKGY